MTEGIHITHAKYLDSEAIAAVEGEATLVLAGDVTIAVGKTLGVDVIAEKGAGTGVTIDSVLLKDGLVDGIDVAARDHAKYTDAEAITAVEGEATLVLAGAVTIAETLGVAKLTTLAVAGNPLVQQNTTDAISNQVGILSGANATRADNDKIYQSWMVATSTGTQAEFVRVATIAEDVTNGSKDGRMLISSMRSNSLQEMLSMGSEGPGSAAAVRSNPAGLSNVDFIAEGTSVNILFADSGLDVLGVGGAPVSGKMLSVYGDINLPQATLISSSGIIDITATTRLDLNSPVTISGATVLESTLNVAGLSTLAVAGVALDVQNTTDDSGLSVVNFLGGNRATPTAGDNAINIYKLDDSNGAQTEIARTKWVGRDLTAGAEYGAFEIEVQRAGSSAPLIRGGFITATNGFYTVNESGFDLNIRYESNDNINAFVIDGGLNVAAIGGAAVSGKMLSLYGTLSFPQASTIETTTGDLTLASAGNEIRMLDQLVLKITDTDGVVEGSIWYDASDDKLKFKTAAGVETITSA